MKLTLKHGFSAIILLLSFASPVAAGHFEDGNAAYALGDYATALRLWRPLAEQGNAEAQERIGSIYYNGEGVPKDYRKAAMWYRRAAEQGDASAENNLGIIYFNGDGAPQDYAAALRWYRAAAEQGNTISQRNLGAMYYNGQGVQQDFVQAHMWFNLAAARGEPDAAETRDMIASHMTPAQIAEAQKLAREWKPTKQRVQ